jgi:hypothetical protein
MLPFTELITTFAGLNYNPLFSGQLIQAAPFPKFSPKASPGFPGNRKPTSQKYEAVSQII